MSHFSLSKGSSKSTGLAPSCLKMSGISGSLSNTAWMRTPAVCRHGPSGASGSSKRPTSLISATPASAKPCEPYKLAAFSSGRLDTYGPGGVATSRRYSARVNGLAAALGLEPCRVVRMLESYQGLARFNHQTLADKCDALAHMLGLQPADISEMIALRPQLLAPSLVEMERRWHYWLGLLAPAGRNQAQDLVREEPWLLLLKTRRAEQLLGRVSQLLEVPRHQVVELLLQHSRLLRSSKGLHHKLQGLAQLLGGRLDSPGALAAFAAAHPQLLLYSTMTLRAKLDALLAVSGLSREEVVEVLIQQPDVLLDMRV